MNTATANKLSAKVTIDINAPVSSVWNALIKPALIKQYLHGTDTVTNWKPGSPIEFTGNWKGKSYLDKGTILKKEDQKILQYTWLSSLSGLEDVPENYSVITYQLQPKDMGTQLTLTQENVGNEEARKQSEKNWTAVLHDLKEIVEQGTHQ
jgi:uncharacterized protein YndB with AHSA1/START domain